MEGGTTSSSDPERKSIGIESTQRTRAELRKEPAAPQNRRSGIHEGALTMSLARSAIDVKEFSTTPKLMSLLLFDELERSCRATAPPKELGKFLFLFLAFEPAEKTSEPAGRALDLVGRAYEQATRASEEAGRASDRAGQCWVNLGTSWQPVESL